MSCQTKINRNCPTFREISLDKILYSFHHVKNAANQATSMGRDGHGLGVNSKFESPKLTNIGTSTYNITFGSKITQCSGEDEGISFRSIQWYTEVCIQ